MQCMMERKAMLILRKKKVVFLCLLVNNTTETNNQFQLDSYIEIQHVSNMLSGGFVQAVVRHL